MKKISRLLACAVLCFASLLCTTACGVEIEDARVKSGTLETTVVKGEELDTSNVVVVVNYSDDTTAEITASELSFSTVDTSVVTDNAKLTITFDNYSFDVNIKVVASEYDVNEIAMFEWTSQGLYKSHIANGQTTFKNPTYNSANAEHEGKADKYLGIEPRYVGYDNPFVLDINAGGYDAMGEEVRPGVKTMFFEAKFLFT